ncbi:MAG: DUF1801 domain-containing protein [Chitinophagales bacterium]|nr:DUF1801 domain-containing protein [Bacteroidota bacterium]MBK9505164.1 DUF1801 domain-containing protein [Bacteroidota bacterium]MBP8249842.1 DUF1801 domain-containing protein [Chitinophagales bacterium]
MDIQKEISDYIASQPEAKRNDMQALHQMIVTLNPDCKLWFLDGKNSENKVVSNPNIGYGLLNLQYAGGKTKPFYQIGMSANTSGISVYIMGLSNKLFLSKTYGQSLGKASISGYCIKFKALKDIQVDVLLAAIKHGFATT